MKNVNIGVDRVVSKLLGLVVYKGSCLGVQQELQDAVRSLQAMNLRELKDLLSSHLKANVRFFLPDGSFIAAHAHVTEAARIDKKFVDCGGTFRQDSYCRLQTWVADDTDHRLTAGKLLGILEKAESILLSEDLEVDIEHEIMFISQFPLEKIEASDAEVVLQLTVRHTACLAPEKCCPPTPEVVSLGRRNSSR